MGKVLSLELKRAFASWPYFLALMLGVVLVVVNIVLTAWPSSGRLGEISTLPARSLFGNWIGMTPFNIATAIYYYILPLLACIPYASSLGMDFRSHFDYQIEIRVGRVKYFASKAIAVFVSAGSVVTAPLLLNLIVVSCLLPQIPPDPVTNFYAVLSNSMLPDLFYSNPWGYTALFLGMTFVGGGVFGLLGTISAFFVRNAFVAIIGPFGLCAVIQLVTQGTAMAGFSPINVLLPAQPFPSVFSIVLLCIIGTWCVSAAFLLMKGSRHEGL